MKSYLLLMLSFFFATGTTLAQEKTKKEKQTVVIIKTTTDENGNEIIEKIIKDGELVDNLEASEVDGEKRKVIVMKKGSSKTIQITIDEDSIDESQKNNKSKKKEISVNVEETNGVRDVVIKITGEDGKGETINWKGDGKFPAGLRKKLEEKGVNLDILDKDEADVHVLLQTDDKKEERADNERDLLLYNVNINVESTTSNKKINLTFMGKATATSVSLIDETGKQVYHIFLKNFKGFFDKEINIKDATDTLEIHIKQGHKEFIETIN